MQNVENARCTNTLRISATSLYRQKQESLDYCLVKTV